MEIYRHAPWADSGEQIAAEKAAVQSRPKNDLESVTKYCPIRRILSCYLLFLKDLLTIGILYCSFSLVNVQKKFNYCNSCVSEFYLF